MLLQHCTFTANQFRFIITTIYHRPPASADTLNSKTESAAERAVVIIIVVVERSLTALSMSAYAYLKHHSH